MCVYVCLYEFLCTMYMKGPQKPEGAGVPAVLSHLLCVLETEPRSSDRAMSAFTCRGIFLDSLHRFKIS